MKPQKRGAALVEEIERTLSPTPVLWWLGPGAGFVMRFATITFYLDPDLSNASAPLDAASIRHADMLLTTSAAAVHAPTVAAILENSRTARLVLPKSAADPAQAAGISYARMTTTDADLRIEYFKDNLYGRVYAIPSANPSLDWTAPGGYPHLGYLIRFGRWTIYHAGNCAPYDSLADRLRPFNVTVALLPIGAGNFAIQEAADLAGAIGADWLVPIPAGVAEEAGIVTHMLGHRPGQQFKIFQCGEKWTVPED